MKMFTKKKSIHCDEKRFDRDSQGNTPLHLAILNKLDDLAILIIDKLHSYNKSLGKSLLANQLSPNLFALFFLDVPNLNGSSPLLLCCQECNVAIASKLIGCGADVNLTNRHGKSARFISKITIHCKQFNRRLSIVDSL